MADGLAAREPAISSQGTSPYRIVLHLMKWNRL